MLLSSKNKFPNMKDKTKDYNPRLINYKKELVNWR